MYLIDLRNTNTLLFNHFVTEVSLDDFVNIVAACYVFRCGDGC